jgi:peptidoglycan hydrolase-like protein with peptidoglycan-binding domain
MRKVFALCLVALLYVSVGFAQDTTKSKPATTADSGAGDEKPKRGPVFRPTKDQIEQVQKILVTKKLYSGEPSGKYDDDTRAGIKTFQKGNGLKETGTLNRATLEKFGVELTEKQKDIPVSPNSYANGESGDKKPKSDKTEKSDKPKSNDGDGPKRPAPFQANKDQIAALQTKLKDAKLFAGEANGERSDDLKEAVKKYQEAHNLKATGGINAATLEKAGIKLTDKQKEQVAAQAAYDAAKKN